MDATYRQFLERGLDLSPLGIIRYDDLSDPNYFCTPAGAEIIGWSGGDGIHYCFLEDFGDMVFAVSPMNLPGDYVHPLARNFSDFLRLLLSCGNADILEQTFLLDEQGFSAYSAEILITPEQQSVLDAIQAMGVTSMEHPFSYIKELQAQFDYHKIPFVGDYDFFPPEPPEPQAPEEWAVYFSDNSETRGKPGKPLSIRKDFIWEGRYWLIPEVYACKKGLVIDFCTRIPAAEYRAFARKWNLDQDPNYTPDSTEEQLQMYHENPLNRSFHMEAALNGRPLRGGGGTSYYWYPDFINEMNEFHATLIHYNLDPSSYWLFWRWSFHWAKSRRPKQIATLKLTIKPDPVEIYGPHFTVSGPGDQIQFTHPVTNVIHTLTVQEYEAAEMPQDHSPEPDLDFPTHYTSMIFTLSPDLPSEEISVQGCGEGDQPRKKADSKSDNSRVACGIMIIGGRIDPNIEIKYGDPNQGKPRTAFSNITFEPKDSVEWQMIFHIQSQNEITVSLI